MAKVKLFFDRIVYSKSKKVVRNDRNYNANGANTFYANDDYHVDGLPAQVTLVLSDENGRKYYFEIRENILEYYGKKHISKKMVNDFECELKAGVVGFTIQNGEIIFD